MNLTHHFLLSMPHLRDNDFRDSVVYVLEHGEHGAFGVVINQILGMSLQGVFSQLSIPCNESVIYERDILRGGPVDEGHGLVLHPPGPMFELTRNFEGGVSLSSSRDILESLARGEAPYQHLVLLGHSGWAPGQLEMEIASNAWLTAAADSRILFDTPLSERRQAVAQLLGVDLSQIVGQSGHA